MSAGWTPILSLDFDGVLHSYTSGWQGAETISDPPVPGAQQFVRDVLVHFRVVVFSTRCATEEGRQAIRGWLEKYSFPPLEVAETKPSAFVSIDDRAVTFAGEWPDVQELLAFKPWNKCNLD